MSLAVVFKNPEGIVLAADSRVTVTATIPNPFDPQQTQVLPAYFDNARKLFGVKGQPYVGMVTYGAGVLGLVEPRTAHGYLPEFETHLQAQGDGARLTVENFAREVGQFYLQQWTASNMPPTPLPPGIQPLYFQIAGFDEDQSYGRVFQVNIPDAPVPVELHPADFGISWGGQSDLVERLLNGFDGKAVEIAKNALGLDDLQAATLLQAWRGTLGLPIPYQFLPLQDCVDMSTLLVSITSEIQTWEVAIRGVGGEIDVATITRTDGFQPIHEKKLHEWD